MLKKIFSRNSRTGLPQQPASFSGEAYTNCADLPLWVWVEINETKDLKYLLIKGNLPVERLVEIWSNLNDEYRQLIRDVDNNHSFDLKKQTFTEDKDLITITAIVNQLRIRRNDELIEILKNDFNFRLNYVDLTRDLDMTLKQAKFRGFQLKEKEKQLESLATGGKSFDKFEFIEQLVVLSEFQGYHLKLKELSLAEYIAVYNRFKADIEFKLRNA